MRRLSNSPGLAARVVVACLALTVAVVGCSDGGGTDPIREGRDVYGRVCSACHGSIGEGGVGPGLGEVLATFPACADQIEWVELGSDGWAGVHGPTYGAGGKAVAGGMPGHQGVLTEREIAAVVAYERVRHGGGGRDQVIADCGLDDPAG